MHVITIKRTISKIKRPRLARQRFARDFFACENQLHFAIEALLFGALLALCAWPIIAAAGAICRVL